MVSDCGLTDLPSTCAQFTWWNSRDEDPIGKTLDRALVNGAWMSYYPQAYAHYEAGGVSDHARCYVRCAGTQNEARKPFRFFNYLAEHPDFLPTFAEVWNSTEPILHSRAALTMLDRKMKVLKEALRALNITHYGDISNRTKQANEELCDCQNKALHDPEPETFARATAASEKWNHLAHIEEKYYRQKSCVIWLQAGDQNTKYFHRVAQGRAARNMIRRLVNAQGETLLSQPEIKKEAVSHFQDFLQTQDPSTADVSVDYLRSLLTY